jgi:hypothetical protein
MSISLRLFKSVCENSHLFDLSEAVKGLKPPTDLLGIHLLGASDATGKCEPSPP